MLNRFEKFSKVEKFMLIVKIRYVQFIFSASLSDEWNFVHCQIFWNFKITFSSFLGRPNKATLAMSIVCTYVCTLCPHSTKRFPDSHEIWYVGRGRWVQHDGMPWDPIQGQGHETLKVRKSAIFKTYLLPHCQCELANDCRLLNYRTISKFVQAGFLIFSLVFMSRDFEVRWSWNVAKPVRRSRPSALHRANF